MPVLLLHGTASSLHTWDGWTDIMKDSFEVIRLDLPAYGLTGPYIGTDYSYEHYVSFLDSFVTEVGIDSFHIGGNSFGGAVAFTYTATHPEKVGKVLLIDAAGIDEDRESPGVFKLAKNPVTAAILKKVTPKSFLKKNLEEVYANDQLITDELVTRYHDFAIRKGNRQAFIDRVNQNFKSIEHHLSSIENETLIQWGRDDMWTPVKWASVMHSLIPNSTLKIYDNLGHVGMEENAELTGEDALRFLLEK